MAESKAPALFVYAGDGGSMRPPTPEEIRANGYARVYTHECPNGHEWRGAVVGSVIPCPWCAVRRAERAEAAAKETERLRANLAAIRCEIDARRDCASLESIRHYADEATDMRAETLMAGRPWPGDLKDPTGGF